MPGHDVIVIGASAGGLEVLLELAAALPARFPASLHVVLHVPGDAPGLLPELLAARGRLPAVHPFHGDPIRPGAIYVAPPDNQLLVRRGRVEVVRAAKENGHRPAVDPLFRSAARAYGPRVVGVVLSGYQDCGTAGLLSVKARGGVAVVQEPGTARAEDMPRSALAHVAVDHVVPPAELAGLLVRLAGEPAGGARTVPAQIEALEGERPGAPAEIVCPLCQGALTEASVGAFQAFRCHEGHTFSLDALAREQGEEVERALWAAARALDESAAVNARLMRTSASPELRPRFEEKAALQRQHAAAIRRLLTNAREPDPRAEAHPGVH